MRSCLLPPAFTLVLAFILPSQRCLAVDVMVTAVAGRPYGVATIEIPLQQPIVGVTLSPIRAVDVNGRILYPFSEDIKVGVPPASETPVPRPGNGRLLGRLGNLIREIAGTDEQLDQTIARRVTFLFLGSEPLKVRVDDATQTVGSYEVVPDRDEVAHGEMMSRWWFGYIDAARSQIDAADYPTLVETYMTAMLARRTGMALPTWYLDSKKEDDELLGTLKLIAGGEAISDRVFRRVAVGAPDIAGMPDLGGSADRVASLPLPPPPRWDPLFDDPSLAGVPVEPMATRVPPECFYIRYGSFANYLWFTDLSNEYGGDISSMVTLRGIETGATRRIEQQLNLKTTELSRMIGPSVIEDQAIIGRDLFMNDGASLGVMFKAKNAFLLKTSFANDRVALTRSDDEVSLKDVKVGDRTVSLLSTADNRVRSFMVQDGDYFLVTNSRSLVERFLEVGKNAQSLAATSSFLLARRLMPLERGDVVFAYFSPEMLRGLTSPQYLIELRRRLSANAEIAMMHLARSAADQEARVTGESVVGMDELIRRGYLPRGFGVRLDGSGAINVGERVMDSRRGTRGRFLPIVDIEIEAVTPEEASWYGQIAAQYESRFPTIDPIMIGVGREATKAVDGGNGERITMHAEIAPLVPEKYGQYAKYLGPPTQVAMQFSPDDIVALQAHVAAEELGPPTHLFAAIKDSVPPDPGDFDGLLNTYRSLRGIPGYIGAWPQPGMLDRLPLGLGRGQPVGPGTNRLLGGLYRYADGEFSVLSFQPDVLQASLPFLAAIDVPDAAQVRMRSGNLNGSQLEGWVNAQLYDRARQSSVAGASLMSLLTRQLGVAPEQVPIELEKVLGAKLQCALGGEFVYSDGGDRWISTAWRGDVAPAIAPADYVAPPMKWFRGATATVTQYADRVVADAVIDVAR